MPSKYIHKLRDSSGSRNILRLFHAVYLLAVLSAVAYVCLIAEDRYISKAVFKISKEQSSMSSDPTFLEFALPGLSDSGGSDANVCIGYIASAELLLHLEEKFKLIERYSAAGMDVVFSLDPNASVESRLDFYRSRIKGHFDGETGLTTLSADCFEPKLAQKIAQEALSKAEEFINGIDQAIAEQQLAFAKSELELAEQKVIAAHKDLIELQNKHQLISPSEVITSRLAAVQEMQIEKLRTEAELASVTRDSPESPVIDNLRSKLQSLKELIDAEMGKMSGPERDRMNQVLMEFQEIELKIQFATQLRSSAEMLFESHRINSHANTRFFSVIQAPNLPEDALLPKRFYVSATIIVLSILLFLIIRALLASAYDRN